VTEAITIFSVPAKQFVSRITSFNPGGNGFDFSHQEFIVTIRADSPAYGIALPTE
jgi:hypothetical protein